MAAENFWGSIAAQLGGVHAHVVSIITNPNTDPHAYEPTAADARVLAGSQLVVENGIGYDPWVAKLLAADPPGTVVLDVGTRARRGRRRQPPPLVRPGRRPHRGRRRSPPTSSASTRRTAPTSPGGSSHFETVDPGRLRRGGRRHPPAYAGTPVGASESIFAMLAPSLGLDLITPPTFLKAISEGTDVPVADKETIDTQIRTTRSPSTSTTART